MSPMERKNILLTVCNLHSRCHEEEQIEAWEDTYIGVKPKRGGRGCGNIELELQTDFLCNRDYGRIPAAKGTSLWTLITNIGISPFVAAALESGVI